MISQDLILANAKLVLPNEVKKGGIVVKDGLIQEVFTGSAVPSGAIDCDGDYLSPGLVELHTDNLERHMAPRPGVDWPRAAAVLAHDAEFASVGVTTLFDALRVGSIISGDGKGKFGKYARSMVDEILSLRKRDALRISHFFHLRAEICSETMIDEMAEFGPADRIGIVSIMDHTPGQRQFADLRQFRVYLQGKKAMADDEVEQHFDLLRQIKATHGPANEINALEQARSYGAVIASHDDTTCDHVKRSAANGIRVAEFPTTLVAAAACHENDIRVMMGAPNLLRGGSHSGNVAASDLVEKGLLDILSSDYVPGSLLMAAVRLGQESDNLSVGINVATRAPAKVAGLTDRGEIACGLRADLTRFCLFETYPRVRGVWVRGARVS